MSFSRLPKPAYYLKRKKDKKTAGFCSTSFVFIHVDLLFKKIHVLFCFLSVWKELKTARQDTTVCERLARHFFSED